MSGYRHPYYAESLSEFGEPRFLQHSGGWILRCRIPDAPFYDARGCYPIFSCQDWTQLNIDLARLGEEDLLSLTLVTDPFGEYTENHLKKCFKSIVLPFKIHYVIDLNRPLRSFVGENHRRNARKAMEILSLEKCENELSLLDDWVGLYSNLIARHDIKGVARFSKPAFARQLKVPGLSMFRATYEGRTAGMLLWYLQNSVAYYHLGAYSSTGYDLRASFALFWFAIQFFADHKVRWLNLGGGAGVSTDGSDGLSRFKRGWSNETKTAFLCGHIFDHHKYESIVEERNKGGVNYFPAYRHGECN